MVGSSRILVRISSFNARSRLIFLSASCRPTTPPLVRCTSTAMRSLAMTAHGCRVSAALLRLRRITQGAQRGRGERTYVPSHMHPGSLACSAHVARQPLARHTITGPVTRILRACRMAMAFTCWRFRRRDSATCDRDCRYFPESPHAGAGGERPRALRPVAAWRTHAARRRALTSGRDSTGAPRTSASMARTTRTTTIRTPGAEKVEHRRVLPHSPRAFPCPNDLHARWPGRRVSDLTRLSDQ
jgi:hypothetical protein